MEEIQTTYPFKCPKCGAPPNEHGKGGFEKCVNHDSVCQGLLCECDGTGCDGPQHGEVFSDPCRAANCYHCGWGGRLPRPIKGLQPWEKKALAAGWTPPKADGGTGA